MRRQFVRWVLCLFLLGGSVAYAQSGMTDNQVNVMGEGDVLTVPEYNNTVKVNGAVMMPNKTKTFNFATVMSNATSFASLATMMK